MATTYRECPACGKRVLIIATRCPACAYELPAEQVRRHPSRRTVRLTPFLPILGVVLAVGGLVTVVVRLAAHRDRAAAANPDVQLETPIRRDTVSAVGPPVTADSAPSPGAVPRVTRTWTKVRAARGASADVVAVLLPGDTVLVDSLTNGWWRVALDGRVLGYVHRRTLVGD